MELTIKNVVNNRKATVLREISLIGSTETIKAHAAALQSYSLTAYNYKGSIIS